MRRNTDKSREGTRGRHCKPCTACCDGWLQISIRGVAVFPGKPCPHSTGKGCGIYESRPENPCATFFCGWVRRESPLPNWMKPNNAKVIVFMKRLMWHGSPVIYALPVGRKIPDRSLNWLKQYSDKNSMPLVYAQQIEEAGDLKTDQLHIAYGSPEFKLEFKQWLIKHLL